MENCDFFDDLLEFLVLSDENGNISKCNKTILNKLGYDIANPPKKMSSVFPQIFEEGAEQLDTITGKMIDTDIYKRNHTCFPVVLKITKMANGEYLFSAVDNSQKKEVEKELAKTRENLAIANTNKTDFISNITHELRTPVNGVLGLTRSLLETGLTPAQLDTLNIIERCCVNMSKIINDFLDFSKLESGKLELEDKEFNFRDFVNKVMASNVVLVNDKGLKLMLYIADDIPTMLIGDELRLTQVLNNLISNALKFTSVGYITIEITVTQQDDDNIELFFVVMDTGIGIAKENMDKLFRRFSQVDSSITRRFGGTGLGLSICRQLVQMMGGDIKVESEEGKGSVFSYNVKLKKAAEQLGKDGIHFPSGKFVYEGNGQFNAEGSNTQKSIGFELDDTEEKFRFGTKENIEEITKNMEKLLICIDMDNWDKAENFAGIIKNLASDDKDLKREIFRLELSVRKGDKDNALKQFETVKQKISEVEINE